MTFELINLVVYGISGAFVVLGVGSLLAAIRFLDFGAAIGSALYIGSASYALAMMSWIA